jgi:DNA polymerase III subunit beta
MKLHILQSQLKQALSTVAPAIPNKSTLPVLSNVLLDATDGLLWLSTTNLEISITTEIGADIEASGGVTLPFALLRDTVSNYSNDKVSLTLDDVTQTVTLTCGKNKSQIRGIEANEFPNLPQQNGTDWFDLPIDTLRSVHARVAVAAADDDTRPILAGVHIAYFNDKVYFEAADGFRCARLETRFDAPQAARQSVIVRKPTFAALSNAMQGETVTLSVSTGQSHVIFNDGTTTLAARTIEGTFPEVQRVFDQAQQWTTRAVVDSAEFAKATKLTALYSQEVSKIARKLDLEWQSVNGGVGNVIVSSTLSEIGTSSSDVECIIEGVPLHNALDCNRLADAIAACKSQQIALEMRTADSPVAIRPVGDSAYWHIVMPVN